MPQKRNNTKKDTSWQSVASWYDKLVEDPNSYQSKVVLPNLVRLLDIKSGEKFLDIACGQGFFSKTIVDLGGDVSGIDLSGGLIDFAKKNVPKGVFHKGHAHDLSVFGNNYFDKAIIVLALQNIKEARETLFESNRVLKSGGKLYIVLNHPSFRIPGQSDWVEIKDADLKPHIYRRVDSYMSESSKEITMKPSKGEKSPLTYSFHRPFQFYAKTLNAAGFHIGRVEEWISHRDSQTGPKKLEEDRIRKEIPLFMCIECIKV